MKKKIALLLTAALLLTSLAGCGGPTTSDNNTAGSASNAAETHDSTEKNDSSSSSETEYYSCLTKDGSGLKFNITTQEFLDRYNALKPSYEDREYKDLTLSDFFYVESGTNINGTSGDAYGCSQTIMGEFSDLLISINKEENGDNILSISFGIKNNNYRDMYYSDDMLPKILTQYTLLICAATGCDMSTASNYVDELMTNEKTYDKGIAFTCDTYNEKADWFRIIPCTKEQYDDLTK